MTKGDSCTVYKGHRALAGAFFTSLRERGLHKSVRNWIRWPLGPAGPRSLPCSTTEEVWLLGLMARQSGLKLTGQGLIQLDSPAPATASRVALLGTAGCTELCHENGNGL